MKMCTHQNLLITNHHYPLILRQTTAVPIPDQLALEQVYEILYEYVKNDKIRNHPKFLAAFARDDAPSFDCLKGCCTIGDFLISRERNRHKTRKERMPTKYSIIMFFKFPKKTIAVKSIRIYFYVQ